MSFKKLTVVAVHAACAVAADPLGLIFPPSAKQCEPTLIQWVGGQGPFELGFQKGEDRQTVELFPNISADATSFVWQTDFAADTIFSFSLSDSIGGFTGSPLFIIQPGTDGCVLH